MPRLLDKPLSHTRWAQAPAGAGGDAPASDGRARRTGATLFAELVWEHDRWERDRRENGSPGAELERAYREKLAEFEDEFGKLEQVYWSRRSASAVAMTVKKAKDRPRDRLRLREGDDDDVRLHRLSDWVTQDAPELADLLQECDLLAIRVAEVLRGTSERIAMRWIYGIETHLLGFFERTDSAGRYDPRMELIDAQASMLPPPGERVDAPRTAVEAPRKMLEAQKKLAGAQKEVIEAQRKLVAAQRRNLAEIEDYYHRAASKAGRIVFTSGMLIGMLPVALAIAVGLLLAAAGVGGEQLEILLLCFGSGAVGALISAMSRMGRPERGTFDIDFELGRPLMRRLGVYRPFVGAAVGAAVYFLLASGILDLAVDEGKETYFYGSLAFLSGFSERFATVVFGTAERRLGGAPKESPAGRP